MDYIVTHGLTEDQIERRVSSTIDRIDARFMSGKLTQEEYDDRMRDIHRWAEAQYEAMARMPNHYASCR